MWYRDVWLCSSHYSLFLWISSTALQQIHRKQKVIILFRIIISLIRVWVCLAKIQILVYCDMRMYFSYVGDERPIQCTIKFIHWSVNTKDWFLIIWWSSFCSAALLFLQAAKWNFPSERTVIFVYTVLFKLVYYPNKALFLL